MISKPERPSSVCDLAFAVNLPPESLESFSFQKGPSRSFQWSRKLHVPTTLNSLVSSPADAGPAATVRARAPIAAHPTTAFFIEEKFVVREC